MNNNKLFLGIDVGSISTDLVVLDKDGKIVYSDIIPTSSDGQAAESARMRMVERSQIRENDIVYAVACGYGRENVRYADTTVTEITCHAAGAYQLFPEVRTIIDIGGEDTKAIGLDDEGRVRDFMLNNKCAAGTGRFLEAIAGRLACALEDFIAVGAQSKNLIAINKTCTVFAESEVVSLLADGCSLADISHAVHRAIAERIMNFAERLRAGGAVVLTGGVAKNLLIVTIMREELGCEVFIPEDPQLVGAYGAALVGRRLKTKD